MNKQFIFLFIIMLFFFNLSFAGGLVSKEAVYHYNEGVSLQKQGNYEQTKVLYQKTLILDPENNNWQKFIMNNYGIIYIEQGELQKAEAAFNEALKLDPNYKPARLNLGLIYDMQPDRLKALQYWLKVLNINLEELKPKNFIIEGEQK